MAKRIIIPARISSTRLPSKPLLDVVGKSLIQRVYEQALKCNFDSVLVATDSLKIAEEVQRFNGDFCMTSTDHDSGTDRIVEVVNKMKYNDNDIIINIQGDEPLFLHQNIIDMYEVLINNNNINVSTVCEKINDLNQIFDSNSVKVVVDKYNHALYFSRAPIPWERNFFDKKIINNVNCYRHIGLYAYKCSFIKNYKSLEISSVENIEMLEQLRILWNGVKIIVCESKSQTPKGVDTIEDLQNIRKYFYDLENK